VDWMHLTQNRSMAGSCEHGNETLASIKARNLLTR
jgi:hypothetical protein